MRLIDHIAFDLSGRANVSTMSPQALAWWLTDLYGGNSREAARQLGVAESTFRSWRHGATPKQASIDKLRYAARQAGAETKGRNKALEILNGADLELTIRGVFTYSADTRERTIHPGRYIPATDMRLVVATWLQGHDDQAEDMLISLIDRHYQPFEFDQVYWARFLEPGEQVR